MGRIRTSWGLAKRSWQTLRSDRSLAWFPVLSAVVVLAFAAAFWIPAGLLLQDGVDVVGVILAAIGLYVTTFIGVFFSVALAACASRALDGEDTTVAEGFAAARSHLRAIAGWAALAASVNIILRAIEQRFQGVGGAIVAGLGGAAWALVTFLAVPVITLEGLGPVKTLKRSATLFRQRWGEQLVGQVGIGAAVGLIGVLPGMLIAVLGGLLIGGGTTALGAVLLVVGIMVILVASVIGNALSQIFAVALYRYAAQGEVAGPFTEAELSGAVRQRSGGFGRRSTV
jgi:hypothetical protein